MSMRCKGRVFKDTGQGANFIVILVALVLIFKTKITSVVTNAFKSFDKDSKAILK